MAAADVSRTSDAVDASQQPLQSVSLPKQAGVPFEAGAPVNFVYLHVHNAIRDELLVLEAGVKDLLRQEQPEQLQAEVSALRERYTFLERIYKYHSSVEDEASTGRTQPFQSVLSILGSRCLQLRGCTPVSCI